MGKLPFILALVVPVLAGTAAGATQGGGRADEMNRSEQNKEVVRAYVEAFNQGDLEALRALFTPDAVIQGVLRKGGMDEILPIWRELIEGLGIQLEVEEMVAEGDLVAVRYIETGTFKGPFFGNQPTGKSYELVAMEFFVVRDGKIHQRWGARDAASQARQIGLPLE